jgi:hypothetical protein
MVSRCESWLNAELLRFFSVAMALVQLGKVATRVGENRRNEGQVETLADFVTGLTEQQVQKNLFKLPVEELEKMSKVIGQLGIDQLQGMAAAAIAS